VISGDSRARVPVVCQICFRRVTETLRRALKLVDIRAKAVPSHSGRHDGDAKENDRTRFAEWNSGY
jgi:hypothetical protein